MTANAITSFLRSLDDPDQFFVVRGVPVFAPHRLVKRDAQGKAQEVEVTTADLKEIAEHNNRREDETGTLAVITLGHRLQGRDVPERAQPPVVGFCRNWRVGRFAAGSGPVLLCDEYIRQEYRDEAGEYPHRSCDYYRGRKEISGVAKLKKDAELDLGTLIYQGADGLLCYSREVQDMADPTMPPEADEPMDAPAPNPDMGGEPDGDEGADRESYERHCASHKYARAHHERQLQYAMEAAGSPPPPGGGGDAPPPMPPGGDGAPPPAPEPFARRDTALTYARLDRENKDLKARLATLEKRAAAGEQAARLTQYARELEQLAAEGVELDVDDEMASDGGNCGAMGRAQFDRHKERIALRYERSPAATRPVAVVKDAPQPAKYTQRTLEAVEQYLRQHEGCAHEEAEEYARGKRTLLGTPVQS